MKKLNKVIASALMGVALVSCNDLDTVYEGSYVTSETKSDVYEINPEMAVAGVTGITANFSRYLATISTSTSRIDYDYGYAGVMLGLDHQTADMNSRYIGYNWFNDWAAFSDINPNGDKNLCVWKNEYNQIFVANAVLSSIPEDSESEELQLFRAQAHGFRAFNYWVLAQLFQFNYQGNEDKPCVPIITAENAELAASEGAIRATVKEVYDQILSDLNTAIEKSEATTLRIGSYVPSKPRRMLYIDALYGLRARVNLTMGKYAEAAADAKKAIALSSATPLSIQECSKPGFGSMSDHNWMWGIAIAITDRVVTSGIINNPSMLCTFCGNGYVPVGCWRAIATDLWDAIPSTDVRKGWWLDDDYQSPILTDAQQAYLDEFGYGTITDSDVSLLPHTNVKFDSYNSVIGQTDNANDIPLMRIEEMYYIAAEGLAMSNQLAEASDLINNFEQTYRNPNFINTASTPEAFQEMIWNKRRVEFWGEGLSYFDLLRLNKGVDRRSSGCVSVWRYNIQPKNPVLIMMIPEDEMQANPALNLKAPAGEPNGNNEQGIRPVAGV